jgi:lysophospholipase
LFHGNFPDKYSEAGLRKRDTSPYAPAKIQCPSQGPEIRSAAMLSANESQWLNIRRNKTITSLLDFLSRVNISGFDATQYIHAQNASNVPTIGIAVSGGGYRALMNGAGVLAAFDNRTTNSTAKGHLGGLLQSSTYLSGLSGGSWLVGSLYMQNFPPVQDIVVGPQNGLGSLWQFNNSILAGDIFHIALIT